MVTNPLLYYSIVEVDYAGPLLINKPMFIDIEIKVAREASCTYDSSAKLRRKTKPN